MTGLERFMEAKRQEVAELEGGGLEHLCPWRGARPAFSRALEARGRGPLAVIAEYKRASPSRGVICESLEPEEAALQYADAGACAVSVLTEERWFHGHVSYLARMAEAMEKSGGNRPPLLRKDFLFHPAQVAATLATPASALLLIVRLTPSARMLRDLREMAEQGGVEAVVEVFDENDLALARESGARIIQVNARDLATLRVDRQACLRLIERRPPEHGELWIAASGMHCRADLEEAAARGFAAALVGSALMEGGRPGEALAALLSRKEAEDAD